MSRIRTPVEKEKTFEDSLPAPFHTFTAARQTPRRIARRLRTAAGVSAPRRENPAAPLNWRVEKMKLSKDKSALIYKEFLTLDGIPPETFEYRLGKPPPTKL
jgi:hypothetical protein